MRSKCGHDMCFAEAEINHLQGFLQEAGFFVPVGLVICLLVRGCGHGFEAAQKALVLGPQGLQPLCNRLGIDDDLLLGNPHFFVVRLNVEEEGVAGFQKKGYYYSSVGGFSGLTTDAECRHEVEVVRHSTRLIQLLTKTKTTPRSARQPLKLSLKF